MEETPITKLLVFAKDHFLLVGVAVLGIVFLSVGAYFLLPKSDEAPIILEQADTTPMISVTSSEKGVVVDVSGAVVHPGVYTLPKDSRVKDAILAAGGLRDDANQESISKAINLAQILTDGIKIYLPFLGEEAEAEEGIVAGTKTKLIHLNTATLSELDSLPKIGEVTAQKIIDNRSYSSVEDLVTKKVVSATVLEAIKSMIAP